MLKIYLKQLDLTPLTAESVLRNKDGNLHSSDEIFGVEIPGVCGDRWDKEYAFIKCLKDCGMTMYCDITKTNLYINYGIGRDDSFYPYHKRQYDITPWYLSTVGRYVKLSIVQLYPIITDQIVGIFKIDLDADYLTALDAYINRFLLDGAVSPSLTERTVVKQLLPTQVMLKKRGELSLIHTSDDKWPEVPKESLFITSDCLRVLRNENPKVITWRIKYRN